MLRTHNTSHQRFWILLCMLSFVIVSCSKEHTITVKANDADTGAPIPEFEYYITSTHNVNGAETYETVAYGKTGVSGIGRTTFKMKKGRSYALHAVEPLSICYINTYEYPFTGENVDDATFQFTTTPCAHLTLLIQNIGCTGDNDKMNFRMRYSYSNWGFWSKDYLGCYNNVTHLQEVATGDLWIQWKTTKSGYTLTDSVQVHIDPYQGETFHLYY